MEDSLASSTHPLGFCFWVCLHGSCIAAPLARLALREWNQDQPFRQLVILEVWAYCRQAVYHHANDNSDFSQSWSLSPACGHK